MIGLDHRDGWQKVWIGSFVCFHMVDVKSDLAETNFVQADYSEIQCKKWQFSIAFRLETD